MDHLFTLFMKILKTSHTLFLVGILLLTAILRLYKLGDYPIHLTPDEAALGYNAWSIWKTGADEYGKWLPIVFTSFGDFKPGLYVYLAVPFVGLFGLHEWTVRLPSALAGIIAVWRLYSLLKRSSVFFETNKKMLHLGALWAAFVLAVNPWHIQFSRGAWESNVLLTMCLGIAEMLIISLQRKKAIWLWGAAILAGLTLWMYQGAKLSTTMLLLAFVIAFGKKFIQKFNWPTLFIAGVLGLLVASPIIWGMFTGQGGRLKVFSIFSYPRTDVYVQSMILKPLDIQKDSLVYKLFYNEQVNFAMGIARRYFNHVSGRFLFVEGDWEHPQMGVPYLGNFYWFEIIAIFGGILFCFLYPNSFTLLLIFWLLLAPVPSALSRDEVNAVRSLHMLLPLCSLAGIGWAFIWQYWGRTLGGKFMWLVIIGAYGFGLCYFGDMFFFAEPKKVAKSQYYGWKQVVEAVRPYRDAGKKVVVNQGYDQPYIYFLFYEQYDPKTYQQVADLEENKYGDVGLVNQIEPNLLFRPVNWSADQHEVGAVFVGDSLTTILPESSSDTKKYKVNVIPYPNGNEAYRVAEVLAP